MWAERMDRDPSERPDYDSPVVWPSDEEPEASEPYLMEVSEETRRFLVDKCTRGVANDVRRRTRSRFPLPKVAATKTPQLDPLMKAEASTGAKARDKELAKIQSFVLDALAPLTTMIDKENRQEAPPAKDYREASLAAVELLGNANARISRLRREKVVTDVNKALLPIALEDDNFRDAPPYLFGNEFAKRSKDYVEQVQAMRSTLRDRGKRPFFRNGPPRRGVDKSRGGGPQSKFRGNRERYQGSKSGYTQRSYTRT